MNSIIIQHAILNLTFKLEEIVYEKDKILWILIYTIMENPHMWNNYAVADFSTRPVLKANLGRKSEKRRERDGNVAAGCRCTRSKKNG